MILEEGYGGDRWVRVETPSTLYYALDRATGVTLDKVNDELCESWMREEETLP